ncbi:hypothetical protein D1P53_000429 [Cryptococcus gattii VGV]|nr:hypothetical protein D1P53_000429 [Cryptococcus gattii VGV]
MPPVQQPLPPAASTLSGPASSLAAAAANATFATPLREGGILRRISQPEVGSPPNNLPASAAVSLPFNSSAVAPQQPASPSPTLSAQDKAKNKAPDNKSKSADSSQQGKPRFQWTKGSNVIDGLHPESHLGNWMDIYENWKVYSTLIAEKRPQFCEEHVIPYFTGVGIGCKGLSPSAIVGRIADLQKLSQDADALQKPDQLTGEGVTEGDIAKGNDTWDTTLGTTNADLTDGNRLHDLFDNGVSTSALLQRDISIADKGGDRVEDGEEAKSILPILRAAGKGTAVNAKELAKGLKGKGKSRRSETFHKC